MQSVLEQVAALPIELQREYVDSLTPEERDGLQYNWRLCGRPEQIAPDGDWDVWLLNAGRGFGKTRSGAEWVREQVETGQAQKIALVAETAADARDVMVSAILEVFPPDQRPEYQSSKRRINFQNGAVAFTYNATEPDQLRGPQHDAAWCDELAKWKYARETWDQLQFGLRLGNHPKVVVTTTPRPIDIIKDIISGEEGRVVISRGSTKDNAANLSARFKERIYKRYEGTRLGRQELNAEVLGDLPGAIWTQRTLDTYRKTDFPEFKRIVIAIDPAVTESDEADEHGVIVAGLTDDDEGRIIRDESLRGSPRDWAEQACKLYTEYSADAIIAEVNQGGDMVEYTVRTVNPNANVRQVRATKGKHVRAEPIAALYEQGRVAHIGAFPELEAQMTQMTQSGYQGEGSPDRLDAAVWALTDLFPDVADGVSDASRFEIPQSTGGWIG